MMKITGLSHLFKWENFQNWWLTKYFFAPLYIDELAKSLEQSDIPGLTLSDTNIKCLLFADDLILLAPSKEALQQQLGPDS